MTHAFLKLITMPANGRKAIACTRIYEDFEFNFFIVAHEEVFSEVGG